MTEFSNTLTNDGLLQRCETRLFGDEGFGSITSSDSRKQVFTNYINDGLANYTSMVMSMDGTWQVDDSNYGDYGIATRTVTSGQSDYQFDASFVQIISMEIKDSTGVWHPLKMIDESEYTAIGQSYTQEYPANALPVYGNKGANSVFLVPTPNYTQAASLRVKYQRPPSYFVSGDTTKQPGFAPTHHQYLVDYACARYAKDRAMANKNDFIQDVITWEQVTIPKLYMKRERDVPKKLSPLRQNNK